MNRRKLIRQELEKLIADCPFGSRRILVVFISIIENPRSNQKPKNKRLVRV